MSHYSSILLVNIRSTCPRFSNHIPGISPQYLILNWSLSFMSINYFHPFLSAEWHCKNQTILKYTNTAFWLRTFHTWIHSWVIYAIIFLTCFNHTSLVRLQLVQNEAPQILTQTGWRANVTPVLASLHWFASQVKNWFRDYFSYISEMLTLQLLLHFINIHSVATKYSFCHSAYCYTHAG